MKLTTNQRREEIKKVIYNSQKPISATALAKQFNVSRQVVVGDIALLRASQVPIIATPRGYLYEKENNKLTYVIACIHKNECTLDELLTIVDCGGSIENVIINHPVYGEIVGNLNIQSRVDVQEFIDLCHKTKAKNLSDISDGVHLHTITVQNEKQYNMILEQLKNKGYLYEKS